MIRSGRIDTSSKADSSTRPNWVTSHLINDHGEARRYPVWWIRMGPGDIPAVRNSRDENAWCYKNGCHGVVREVTRER